MPSHVLRPSEEIRAALESGAPTVALETSVLAHGLPRPTNVEAATAMETAIRREGALPAWIAIVGGIVRIGLAERELRALAEARDVAKVARRDLPAALSGGGIDGLDGLGATTVSAMLWAAHRAGIPVAATGGIGGVHPGPMDVSADLAELARTPGLLVCSGPKSIVDPRATLERLEELGVAVVGYNCDRLPFFIARATDLPLEHRVDTPAAAAALLAAGRELGIESTILLCNPVPDEHALDEEVVAGAVARCQARALRDGMTGKDVTPFLLGCLAEETGGASLDANLALLEANATLAARVAAVVAGRLRPEGA